MQIMFETHCTVEEYVKQGKNFPFPKAPGRCTNPKCRMPVRMKKHGFYKRYYTKAGFSGKILIRRYYCPYCGKTVSFIPHFCLPRFQYCSEIILKCIEKTLNRKCSLNLCLYELQSQYPGFSISRQHMYFYTKRFKDNLNFIEYGLRQISGSITLPPVGLEKRERARKILGIVKAGFPSIHTFSQRFFDTCRKSFLTLLK